MKMNGFNVDVLLVVFGLLTHCQSLLDCNYVSDVSINGIELGSPGMMPINHYGTPIGVCQPSLNQPLSFRESCIYECATNGNSVLLKYYTDNGECSGSNFITFADDSISYSSFKCDGSSNCPYVQYTHEYSPSNIIDTPNPNPCEVDMESTYVTTILTDECYGGTKFTCTNVTLTEHVYLDRKQCSGAPFVRETYKVGCNDYLNVPKITCYSGGMYPNITTTSDPIDTTIDTTLNTITTKVDTTVDTTDTTDTTLQTIPLNCNYVHNVSIDLTEIGSPGIMSWTHWGKPIGVCEPLEITTSTRYECAENGNSVVLKLYTDSNECLGSNFITFAGDSISYSSFKCDGPFNCPYVQFLQSEINDISNPCDVDMNHTNVNTVLTSECYEGFRYICTDKTLTRQIYSNAQCSGATIINETYEVGCNDYDGFFWPEITCYSGELDFTTTSDTKLQTTIIIDTIENANESTAYKSIFMLMNIILLSIAN